MLAAVKCHHLGARATAKRLRKLRSTLFQVLPATIRTDTVDESLSWCLGQTLSAELLSEVCSLMAGNLPQLRQARPVGPWRLQRYLEWSPAQILGCRRQPNPKGKPGASFHFRILAGSAVSLSVHKWWSSRQCRFYSTQLGFDRPWKQSARIYLAPEQLVSLRLELLLSPDASSDEGPGFMRIGVSPALLKWNKSVIAGRSRTSASQCPAGFPPQRACHTCPHSLSVCPSATHADEWTVGACQACGQPERYFSEDYPDQCVACAIARGGRPRIALSP